MSTSWIRWALPAVLLALTLGLVALATVHPGRQAPEATPEGAVRGLMDAVKARDLEAARHFLSPAAGEGGGEEFSREVLGQEGDLRTYSALESYETRVLRQGQAEAVVRASMRWASAVGSVYETRELPVRREGGGWRVQWPLEPQAKVPPQVIPVNYLRWDVIGRGAGDDWGAVNADPPRVRILSMNPVEKDGNFILLGELENEDTVPGFVSVSATLLGKDGRTLASEESFDKINHVLLPKEITPFRIDFPRLRRENIGSVHIQPNALLVPASADPVLGVMHQSLGRDARGHLVLSGELLNESGQTVNIPHVLATFYDNEGKVIWLADSYVDQALLPKTPVPFSIGLRDDLAASVHSYRVTANQYSRERQP